MLIFFIMILIGLFLISYIGSKDIFSPSSIVCIMFLVSGIFANYAAEGWGFSLSSKAFEILIIGISIFVITSLFTSALYKTTHKGLIRSTMVQSSFALQGTLFKINIILFILMALYYYLSLTRIADVSGWAVAATFRNLSRSSEIEMNLIGRISLNILRANSTVFIYIMINNFYSKTFKRNHGLLLLLCVLIYLMLTLLSGERTSIVRMIAVAVLCFGIVWQRNNYHKLIPIKLILTGMIAFIALLYGFSAIRFFVGRSSQLGVIDYIAFYFGSPLYNFNYGIDNVIYISGNQHHTFLGIYNNLAKFGFGEVTSVQRLNVTDNVQNIFFGNTYTCLYDYYVDYHFIGTIILMAIYGFIVTWLYNNALYSKKRKSLKTVIYTFFGTTMFFVAFTEQFYSTYIAVSTIIMLITIWVVLFIYQTKRKGKLRFSMKTREI